MGESLSDYECVWEVAKKLEKYGGIYEDCAENYSGGLTEEEWIKIGYEGCGLPEEQQDLELIKKQGYQTMPTREGWADEPAGMIEFYGDPEANPLETPDATIMPCIEDVRALNLDTLCGGKTSVGTGGMYSKLLSAHRVAQLGVPTAILPGCEPDVIPRLFAGETLGTWVRPEQRTVSRRKYWLAYQADPQGTLYLDTGAADAVRNHGKSLLPGGITEVHGSFEAGALVRIVYDRETVGVGLSNYNAADLLRIRGLKRHEVAAILGDAHYPEVVHRDNLLLDAAL